MTIDMPDHDVLEAVVTLTEGQMCGCHFPEIGEVDKPGWFYEAYAINDSLSWPFGICPECKTYKWKMRLHD